MKTLILVGGGQAHLEVIERFYKTPIDKVNMLLISANRFQYYDGMFSGYVEGIYEKDQLRIDLKHLTQKANAKFLEDAVTAIDPIQKKVLTANGEVLEYDAISFNIGSLTAGTSIDGVIEYARRIKPNYHFVKTIDEVRKSGKVVMVGGGAAGIEISLSLQSWRDKNAINSPVTLISAHPLLANKGEKVSKKIEEIVANRGVQVLTGTTVNKIGPQKLMTTEAEEIAYDHIIWLAGSKAPGLFKTSQLPVDQKGYLKVEDTLQVKSYPSIFGAGACISIAGQPMIEKSGVIALKQGTILYENIKGFFHTGLGQSYRPPKMALSILSLGNKQGFFAYKGMTYSGYLAWLLKNQLDKRFVRKHGDGSSAS